MERSMLKTTEPVIIMTRRELEEIIAQAAREAAALAAKEAVADALKHIQTVEKIRSTAVAEASNGERLMRLEQVETMVSLKKSAIYKMIKSETFPAPIKIGKHATAWKESEVQAWIARRTTGGQ